jgi:hypothetical protein
VPWTTPQLQNLARRYAKQYHVPTNMFMRQIGAESGWNPNAQSPAGALGIAQIVPKWHPGVDPMNPKAALNYAARLMASQYSKYGTWRDALSAYNSGRPWEQGQNIEETRNYVTKIMQGLGQLPQGATGVNPSHTITVPDERKQFALSLLGGANTYGQQGFSGPLLAALQSKTTMPVSQPGQVARGGAMGALSLDELAKRFGLDITSGYRSPDQNAAVQGSPTSYHMQNRARDIAVGSGKWNQFIQYARHNPGMFNEFFFDPLGWYIKNGRIVKGAIGGHDDHLHYAF